MKKILALVLALSLVFVLVSCGTKLSGTYVNEGLLGKTTYEFNGNKVTITIGTVLGDVTYSGKYKIAKDKSGDLKITFTFEDEKAAEYSKSHSFEKTEDGIKISGLSYNKK